MLKLNSSKRFTWPRVWDCSFEKDASGILSVLVVLKVGIQILIGAYMALWNNKRCSHSLLPVSQEVDHIGFLIGCQWVTANSFLFLRCGGKRKSMNSAIRHCWKLSDRHSFDFTSVDLLLKERLPYPIPSPLF